MITYQAAVAWEAKKPLITDRGNPGGPTQGRRSQGQGTYMYARERMEWLRQGQKVIEQRINM